MADDADNAFTRYATATLDGLLDRQPEWATGVGDHRYDDRLTLGTPAHYEQTSRWAGERLAGLAGIDTGRLSPQLQVDAQILANQLTRLRFMIDELHEHEWNPMVANPGRAIYDLLARDFAPLADRLRSVARRLAMLPESLAARLSSPVSSRSVPANWASAVSMWISGMGPSTDRAAASDSGSMASRPATLRSRSGSGAKSRASRP